MIILRKNSHGEIMSLYGNIYDRSKKKKKVKFSQKIPHLTSTVRCFLSDRLLRWKEPILARAFLMYVLNLKIGNPRAKMGILHRSKRSDNKQCSVEVKWGIFCENLTYFFIP